MDFKDTEAEAKVRAEVRAWLKDNVPRNATHADPIEAGRAWQATLHAAGWAGVSWPVEFGGRGGTVLDELVFNEEETRVGAPSRFMFTIAHGMVGPTIMRHGSPEQKTRFLEPMLKGQECWSQLLSEPNAGSDLAGVTTRATLDGDTWVVDGQKVWTSGAHYREWGILLARTDPDAAKHHGLTCFAVDLHAPGIDVRPLRQMTGAAEFNEVFMSGLRLPTDSVIGEVGDGWRVTTTMMMNERVALSGGSGVSAGADAVTGLIELARKQGRSDDPITRQRLADLYIRKETVRFLGLRVRTSLSRGTAAGPQGSIAKLASGLLAQDVGDIALGLLGPAGALYIEDDDEESRWQRSRLQAPSSRIAGGTDEIQRNILGERVLDLPREPRPA